MIRRNSAASAIMLCALAACAKDEKPLSPEAVCEDGVYDMADSGVMGLVPRSDGGLRYFFISGETGAVFRDETGLWKTKADAAGVKATLDLGDCADTRATFTAEGGAPVTGEKRKRTITETVFDGADGKRAGRLVLPADGEVKAIVVSVHGSEKWSGRTGERLQFLLPAYGIGVFAYDKRGTGASEGKYTQDFHILSTDAALAAKEALRLYGKDVPIGFWGGSQGGWVAPLAATKTNADFVIAAYGMAESPIAEDREEVFQNLRAAGYGEDVVSSALEVTDATGRVMASGFKDGFTELAAVKKKFKGAAWIKDAKGEFTGDFMKTPNWVLRIVGPFFDVGTSWEYDPRATLESIAVPHLWILAGDDTEAPHEATLEILRDIQLTRPSLDIALFPNTEHGIYYYAVAEDDARMVTNFAPGYYPLIRDFILDGGVTRAVAGAYVYRGLDAEALSDPATASQRQ